jgi:hypothetical protein
MKKVISLLGDNFEVVPPREFMIMAGRRPTTTTRFLEERPDFSGRWKLAPSRSRNYFPSLLELVIDQRGPSITMTTTAREGRYIHHRELTTTKAMVIGGAGVSSPEEMTRRMGYSGGWSDSVVSSAAWSADGATLVVTTALTLQTQQGTFATTSTSEYALSEGGMTLTVRERRQSRSSQEPVVVLVFTRVL